MSNCVLHKNSLATRECDECGAPICEDCYNAIKFETTTGEQRHLCISCYKEIVKELILQNEFEISALKRERVGIFFGLIIGLIIGIIVTVAYSRQSGAIIVYSILFPIWITFTCGSLITIYRKIKTEYKSEKDNSRGQYSEGYNFVTLALIILLRIIGSPVFTIARLVKSFSEIKEYEQSNRELQEILSAEELA